MALGGSSVVLKVSGTPVSMTNEACTNIGGDNKTYQITASAKQVIDKFQAVTIRVGGTPVTDYASIDYLNGTIVWATATTRTVTVTGFYVPMSAVAEAHNISVKKSCQVKDFNVFGDAYVQRVAGIKSAEGSISDFDVIDNFFLANLGGRLILEYSADATVGIKNRMYVRIESGELIFPNDDMQDATINFKSTENEAYNF